MSPPRRLRSSRPSADDPAPRSYPRGLLMLAAGLSVAALLVHGAGPVGAYGDKTNHPTLTRRAVLLANRDAPYEELSRYVAPLARGAEKEDADGRCVQHFFDPVTGLGLPRNALSIIFEGQLPPATLSETRYKNALDWARDGMPDGFDWQDAIQTYDYSTTAREKAYEALGHVVHLLQDMAQPDHASCRPHPGNWVRDQAGGLLGMAYVDPAGYVGYEKLWDLNDGQWPAGSEARKPPSLSDSFQQLARASREAEQSLGLLKPGETALGLAPVQVDNALLLAAGGSRAADPTGAAQAFGLIFTASHVVWTGRQYARFRDNLWLKYELAMPLLPIIPWPATEKTKPYLELGRKLLPLAEEHTAGLMQLFHDIVNPPPFVESVQILQNNERKYLKAWRDQTNGGRVSGRTLEKRADGKLDVRVEAEVRITFGPYLLENGRDVREPVQGVRVWLEPSSGRGGAADEIRGGFQQGAGGSSTQVWVGRFTPQGGGTLRIEARDTHHHFGEKGERAHAGDTLDPDPATPARVGHESPYQWAGYEEGPDRNHSFRVDGECETGSFPPELLAKMSWGTWTGTIREEYKGKDFDVAFGGHGKYTSHTEETLDITVTFRAAGPPEFQGHKLTAAKFGHGEGTFKRAWQRRFEYADGHREKKEAKNEGEVDVDGYLELLLKPGDREHDYEIKPDDAESDRRKHIRLPHLQGKACAEGNLMGREEKELGNRSGLFWSHRVLTWRFSFTPMAVPAHVPAFQKRPPYPASDWGVDDYSRRVEEALRPAVGKLSAQRRFDQASALARSMSAVHERFYAEYQAIEALYTPSSIAHGKLEALWLSNEPDADTKYDQNLSELQRAIDAILAKKRAVEEQHAAATEQAAMRAQSTSPDVARQLRLLAAKLRRAGAEAFRTGSG